MAAFRPDRSEIKPVADGDVILSFSKATGETSEVQLSRKWLPTLLARLAKEAAPGHTAAIDPASAQNSRSFVVEVSQLQRRGGGAGRLFLTVNTGEDREGVTIPLELSAHNVKSLIEGLR